MNNRMDVADVPTINNVIEKLENFVDLTQDEINYALNLAQRINEVLLTIREGLPRNIYGRYYRKNEDGTFTRDDQGDFYGFQGMGGHTWYRPKDKVLGNDGGKHVAPF